MDLPHCFVSFISLNGFRTQDSKGLSDFFDHQLLYSKEEPGTERSETAVTTYRTVKLLR